jgi:hypothetical protein
MKLYVPEIGDTFTLLYDWTFELYEEQRNKSLWELYDCENNHNVSALKTEKLNASNEINFIFQKYKRLSLRPFYSLPFYEWDQVDTDRYKELQDIRRKIISCSITLPKDSIITVDRIFIRKGMDDWSSLTFYLKHHPNFSLKKKPRFWAKLHDCNKIEFKESGIQYENNC